jgi:hypothetical protein
MPQSDWEVGDVRSGPVVKKPVLAPVRWHFSRSGFVYLAAFVILLLGWFAPPPEGLSMAGWRALMTLSAAVPALAVGAIPDGVLALLIATVWVVGGVVPVAGAFSGFASTSWVLVVSVYLVGSAVASSGLLFRLVLWTLTLRGAVLPGACCRSGLQVCCSVRRHPTPRDVSACWRPRSTGLLRAWAMRRTRDRLPVSPWTR